MPFEIHRDRERGHVEHGWLKTAHSFSFAHYVNPDRMNFGALLVLNEDTIQPGQGFGEHFHDNMEIVTIPLSGALAHADSMGNGSVIRAGDIQIMSAGTGIMHSERNPSDTEPVHLLQIWIIPRRRHLPTRYEEKTFDAVQFANTFSPVVTPVPSPDSLIIHQDAWFNLGRFDAKRPFEIAPHEPSHGIFLFVISGTVQVQGEALSAGDGIACRDETRISGETIEPTQLLAIEVPMEA